MKLNLLQKISRRERRATQRIDKANWSGQTPMISPPAIQYELADRVQATNAGGLGVIQQMVKQLGLTESINRICPIFKMHLPYSEADHVLNIAYNLLAGGTCLEHLELRRKDEAYLNALGAERIPDPTTAGDFCRRFGTWDIFALQESFHEARLKVRKQQPDSFFDQAIIKADGTQVETWVEHKEGMSINYKGEWARLQAYMVMASLAWNLKCWLALSLEESGRPKQKAKLRAEKHRLLRMDFSTFRQTMILIPTQIIGSSVHASRKYCNQYTTDDD